MNRDTRAKEMTEASVLRVEDQKGRLDGTRYRLLDEAVCIEGFAWLVYRLRSGDHQAAYMITILLAAARCNQSSSCILLQGDISAFMLCTIFFLLVMLQ